MGFSQSKQLDNFSYYDIKPKDILFDDDDLDSSDDDLPHDLDLEFQYFPSEGMIRFVIVFVGGCSLLLLLYNVVSIMKRDQIIYLW